MRTKILIGVGVLLVGIAGMSLLQKNQPKLVVNPPATPEEETAGQAAPDVEVIARGLEIPWDIAFLPEGGMLVTERTGEVLQIAADGQRSVVLSIGAQTKGEGGLLGLVLHPQFSDNHFLYIYFSAPGTDGLTQNRVERYQFIAGKLSDKKLIIAGIPGALYHDGGRLEFGPDGYLYITTGDAEKPKLSQDLKSLAGKTLRLRDDGSIPSDNPFGTAVYSYGHRNSQGLAWDTDGRLWSTEHGRSGDLSGLDEINLIVRGGNYGWPESEGDKVVAGTVGPASHSGADKTWAPASAVYWDGSIFFGGLRGETLYEAKISGPKVLAVKEHFKNRFGRIRTVRLGPDGMLYLTTSNRDSRGTPQDGDDKIIRINPQQFR